MTFFWIPVCTGMTFFVFHFSLDFFVEAPVDELKDLLIIWNRLLDKCEELFDKKELKVAAEVGLKTEPDLVRYKKIFE